MTLKFRFRKKRTTKSVGREIGQKLKQIEKEEKIARTLKKEEEIRKRQEKVRKEIAELKARKPTAFKKFLAGARKTGDVVKKVTEKQVTPRRKPSKKKKRKIYSKPIKRKTRRITKRRYTKPAKRVTRRRVTPVRRRTPIRRRTVRRTAPVPRESTGILPGGGIYG